ncbi:hypothetical protein WN55_04934 [Dufourea novaeangliae]|uniref:Uncharacterized protein n=1 Tax=Dufourea novaeangliae TaxID=178035 RepID=A0A154PMS6_DUFNO|nr:hypothetical protein WN55_04934 [Dufourea novaeangliae]
MTGTGPRTANDEAADVESRSWDTEASGRLSVKLTRNFEAGRMVGWDIGEIVGIPFRYVGIPGPGLKTELIFSLALGARRNDYLSDVGFVPADGMAMRDIVHSPRVNSVARIINAHDARKRFSSSFPFHPSWRSIFQLPSTCPGHHPYDPGPPASIIGTIKRKSSFLSVGSLRCTIKCRGSVTKSTFHRIDPGKTPLVPDPQSPNNTLRVRSSKYKIQDRYSRAQAGRKSLETKNARLGQVNRAQYPSKSDTRPKHEGEKRATGRFLRVRGSLSNAREATAAIVAAVR